MVIESASRSRFEPTDGLSPPARPSRRPSTARPPPARLRGTDPLAAGTAYPGYARAAIDRRATTAAAIEAAEADVTATRDALGEAYRALRTLETAQAERARLRAMEEERRERTVLDEVGIQGHRRRSDLATP
jgi:hypothetical protein